MFTICPCRVIDFHVSNRGLAMDMTIHGQVNRSQSSHENFWSRPPWPYNRDRPKWKPFRSWRMTTTQSHIQTDGSGDLSPGLSRYRSQLRHPSLILLVPPIEKKFVLLTAWSSCESDGSHNMQIWSEFVSRVQGSRDKKRTVTAWRIRELGWPASPLLRKTKIQSNTNGTTFREIHTYICTHVHTYTGTYVHTHTCLHTYNFSHVHSYRITTLQTYWHFLMLTQSGVEEGISAKCSLQTVLDIPYLHYVKSDWD